MEEYIRQLTFEVYVTDSIHYISQGKCLSNRYYDIINPVQIEKKSAEKIIDEVIKKSGLKLTKGDNEI